MQRSSEKHCKNSLKSCNGKTVLQNRAKVAGKFFKPISMTKYSNKPMLRRVKAVYLHDYGDMGTFQKPFVMSMTRKSAESPNF
jgi:hypothetical protein